MDEKERQYREYLALRQHEQEEEISREYLREQERRQGRSVSEYADDKYGEFMPTGKPYVPDEREQTMRISNKAKRVSAADNPA